MNENTKKALIETMQKGFNQLQSQWLQFGRNGLDGKKEAKAAMDEVEGWLRRLMGTTDFDNKIGWN